MKLKNLVFISLFLILSNGFAQNVVNEISTKDGIHYITTTINYPITGTYLFEGEEPIVELNTNGTGIFQLHNQAKKEMVWGIECDVNGIPLSILDSDSAAYSLWYKYTTSSESVNNEEWMVVPFSIQFNTSKMYIQGERMKNY